MVTRVCMSLGSKEALYYLCSMSCYWLRRWVNVIDQKRRRFHRADSGLSLMVLVKGLSQ